AVGGAPAGGRPGGLAGALRRRRLLPVLDNCEHLPAACASLVGELLRACPDVRFLATSRAPLAVPDERVHRVSSLPVPDLERLPPFDELQRFDAVRLFLERARASQPLFTLTPRNALDVMRVCRRLDGIPPQQPGPRAAQPGGPRAGGRAL